MKGRARPKSDGPSSYPMTRKARHDGRALFRASHSGVIRVWLPLWRGVWLELIDIGGGQIDRGLTPEQGK